MTVILNLATTHKSFITEKPKMDQMENIGTLRNKQIFHYSRNNGAHDGE